MDNEAKRYVLIIDDDADILYSTKKFLDKSGFKTEIAVNGSEAMDYVNKEPPPDLIVLDMQMPDMDGYTFINTLNKMENRKLIPVIVLSAYSEMERIMLLKGIKTYLVKPAKPEDLLEKINEVLFG